MGDPARIAALVDSLAEAFASNDVRVAWRTLAGEAALRGFASTRAFREWCQRAGVEIREVAGVGLVAVAEVDAVLSRATVRAVPVAARRAEDEVAAELSRRKGGG